MTHNRKWAYTAYTALFRLPTNCRAWKCDLCPHETRYRSVCVCVCVCVCARARVCVISRYLWVQSMLFASRHHSTKNTHERHR